MREPDKPAVDVTLPVTASDCLNTPAVPSVKELAPCILLIEAARCERTDERSDELIDPVATPVIWSLI